MALEAADPLVGFVLCDDLVPLYRDELSSLLGSLSPATLRQVELPVSATDTAADLERAYELSRRYDEHPVNDMLYVALAERTTATIVMADRQLAELLALLPFVQTLTDVASETAV